MKVKAIILAMITLGGCANMDHGPLQVITPTPVGGLKDKPLTICTLENEEGKWDATAFGPTQIHRDGNQMSINCENDFETGNAKVDPRFMSEFLTKDIIIGLLFDACLIGCMVDGFSNSWYEYPPSVFVPMLPRAKTLSTPALPESLK